MSLEDVRVLISAGPTHEPIDPVRFLGNRSSGKMGFALAADAAACGARTTLISGPVCLPTPLNVERINVTTALEMRDAIHERAAEVDLIIMTAAVADFRPAKVLDQKFKKQQGLLRIDLVPNPDILASLAEVAPQVLRVGFAAETEISDDKIRAKMQRKNVDFLVLNDVSRRDIGFGVDENEVTVFQRDGAPLFLSRRPKSELAAELMNLFCQKLPCREPALAF